MTLPRPSPLCAILAALLLGGCAVSFEARRTAPVDEQGAAAGAHVGGAIGGAIGGPVGSTVGSWIGWAIGGLGTAGAAAYAAKKKGEEKGWDDREKAGSPQTPPGYSASRLGPGVGQ